MVIVVMGPAGAGKTTVGAALAAALGWRFVDADEYHSAANLAKMARGEGLTDDDRASWLAALHDVVTQAASRREPLVLACSALTAAHRARLAGDLRAVRFAYLKTSPDVLRARLEARQHHVAKANLLSSQLATLEEPDDPSLVFNGQADVETLVSNIRTEFGV